MYSERVRCCWPTGAVTLAWLPGREGADTRAPINSPQSRQLLQAFWVGHQEPIGGPPALFSSLGPVSEVVEVPPL